LILTDTPASAQGIVRVIARLEDAAPDGRRVRMAHLRRFGRGLAAFLSPRNHSSADDRGQGAPPNIPAKRICEWNPCFSKRLYRERNRIERFFSNYFRRVATRYEKLGRQLPGYGSPSMRLW